MGIAMANLTLPTLQKKSLEYSIFPPHVHVNFAVDFDVNSVTDFSCSYEPFSRKATADLRNSHRTSRKNSHWDSHLQEDKFAQDSLCRMPGATNCKNRCDFGARSARPSCSAGVGNPNDPAILKLQRPWPSNPWKNARETHQFFYSRNP